MLLTVVVFLLLPRRLSRSAVDARNCYGFNKKELYVTQRKIPSETASVLNAREKRSNKSWCDEHSKCPHRKAQEKTEREKNCSLEILDRKAGLLLIVPGLNFAWTWKHIPISYLEGTWETWENHGPMREHYITERVQCNGSERKQSKYMI